MCVCVYVKNERFTSQTYFSIVGAVFLHQISIPNFRYYRCVCCWISYTWWRFIYQSIMKLTIDNFTTHTQKKMDSPMNWTRKCEIIWIDYDLFFAPLSSFSIPFDWILFVLHIRLSDIKTTNRNNTIHTKLIVVHASKMRTMVEVAIAPPPYIHISDRDEILTPERFYQHPMC